MASSRAPQVRLWIWYRHIYPSKMNDQKCFLRAGVACRDAQCVQGESAPAPTAGSGHLLSSVVIRGEEELFFFFFPSSLVAAFVGHFATA